MKFLRITVTANRAVPDAASLWYSIIRNNCEVLPEASRLLQAVARPTQFFAWLEQQEPSQEWAMSCYYLEPLTNSPEPDNEFLIRLEKSLPDGNKMGARLNIVGTESALLEVQLAFSYRGNMTFAGRCLCDLQDALTRRGTRWDSVQIMIEGMRSASKTMKDTMLAAFHWDMQRGEMFHEFDLRR